MVHFPLKTGHKVRMSSLTSPIQHYTASPSQDNRGKKVSREKKRHTGCKGRRNKTAFIEDGISA